MAFAFPKTYHFETMNKYRFILFVLFAKVSFAQNAIIGSYNFPSFEKIEVPEIMKKEEAFFISNVRTIDFDNLGNTKVNYFQRIYINSKEASEQYGQTEMLFSGEGKLVVFNARKIESDGSITYLTKDHFTRTSSNELSKYDEATLERVQLLVPDLEIGDVLDISYTLEYNRYLLSDIMYLEDDLPSMYSRISFRNFSPLELQLFPFNGMPEVKFENDHGNEVTSFEKSNVSALSTDYFNTVPPETPGFNYTLWYQGIDLSYAAIYEADLANFPYNFAPGNSFKSLLPELHNTISELSDMQKLIKFMNFLEVNFEFQPFASSANNALIRDRFKEKVISPRLYTCYVMKFLNDYDIKYARSFSKPLHNGIFRNNLISLEQIDSRFLTVYDEQENIHLVFPPTYNGTFFKLDECPFYIEGNSGIGLLGDSKNLDGDFDIVLPSSNVSTNTKRSMIFATITDFDSITVKRYDKFEGQFSHLARRKTAKDWFEDWNVYVQDGAVMEMDSVFPYGISFQSDEVGIPMSFRRFSDSLVSFDLSSVIPTGVFEEEELKRPIESYGVLPFVKTESVSMNLDFPGRLNASEGMDAFEFQNTIGSISASARQIGTSKMKIQVKLVVEDRFIEESDAKAYMELLEAYHNLRSKKWTFVYHDN